MVLTACAMKSDVFGLEGGGFVGGGVQNEKTRSGLSEDVPRDGFPNPLLLFLFSPLRITLIPRFRCMNLNGRSLHVS